MEHIKHFNHRLDDGSCIAIPNGYFSLRGLNGRSHGTALAAAARLG